MVTLQLAWALAVAFSPPAVASSPAVMPDGYTRRVWQTQDGRRWCSASEILKIIGGHRS